MSLKHRAFCCVLVGIFGQMMSGCSSMATIGNSKMAAEEELRFSVASDSHRIIQAPTINWIVRDDVSEYCKRQLGIGLGPNAKPQACAIWETDKKRCTIITSRLTTHGILGHEMRHCFEGEFHR